MKKVQMFLAVAILAVAFSIPADSATLYLPFFEGEEWSCNQGWGGSFSHHYSYTYHAWDFNWGSSYDDYGLPIAASANGTVSFASWDRFWGNTVIIRHGDGTYARYAHLKTIFVKQGEVIRRSQSIGQMGDTGGNWSSHLHFQVQNGNDSYSDTIPSSFEEVGVPHEGDYYLSQNSQLFADAFDRNGGSDNLGNPINDIHWFYDYGSTGQNCYVQDFGGGSFGPCAIVYDALGGAHKAYVIRTGFWAEWRSMGEGGPSSALGQVLNDEYVYASGVARQDFQYGVMVWNNGGTEVVYYPDYGMASPGHGSNGGTQAMIDCYNENGKAVRIGEAFANGQSPSTVHRWGTVEIQDFHYGSYGWCTIMYDPENRVGENKAYLMRTGFWDKFREWGGPFSVLRCPESNEYVWQGYARQNFADGYYMLWQGGRARVFAPNGNDVGGPGDIPDGPPCVDEGQYSSDPCVHFSWQVPAGSRDTYMQISRNSSFTAIEFQGWLGSTSGDRAYNGTYGHTYFARVRVQGSNGIMSDFGASSNGIAIGMTVATHDEGDISADPVVHFSYPVPQNTSKVRMQISAISNFSNIAWQGELNPTGDHAFSGQNTLTYYARVALKDNGGHWGVYGAPSNGITIGVAPRTNDDGDFSADSVFHVSITGTAGLEHAYVQIATSRLFEPSTVVWEDHLAPGHWDKAYSGSFGTTYWARMKVKDNGGHWTGYGEPSDGITVGRSAKSRDEGDFSADNVFHISYEALAGADAVYMQVATDPGFSQIFWEGQLPPTGDHAFSGVPRVAYYGRVKLIEGGHWTNWGEASNGVMVDKVSATYDDGDYSADRFVTFNFKVLEGAEDVDLQIATDSGFSNVIWHDTVGVESDVADFWLAPNQRYYSRIRLMEGGHWTSWGEPSDGILVASQSTASDEGAMSPDRILDFDFDCFRGVQNVYVEVSRNRNFTDIVWKGYTNSANGTFRYTGIPGEYYYARVALMDNLRTTSLISEPTDGILINLSAEGELDLPSGLSNH